MMSSGNNCDMRQSPHQHEKCSSAFSPSHHCHQNVLMEVNCDGFNECPVTHNETFHHQCNKSNVIATLRIELTKLTHQKSHLEAELLETKHLLHNRDIECEKLKAENARQMALTSSLQSRLNSAESREKSIQLKCESTIQMIQHEKRLSDERCKELLTKLQNLETHQINEESKNKLTRNHMHEFLRRLRMCLSLDDSENNCLSTDCVLTRVEELLNELERTKCKLVSTCDTLSSCERELLNYKTLANMEKQRLSRELDGAIHRAHDLETQCQQYEQDLQLQKEKATEATIITEEIKEKLRVLESRFNHLQNNLDRVQNDRLQFLRCLAQHLNTAEPCETLIKHRLKEILNENKSLLKDIQVLKVKSFEQRDKLIENQQLSDCHLKTEEASKIELADKFEKCYRELHNLKQDHLGLSKYLQRLAKAMNWHNCTSPPALGSDTNILAENLLERAKCFSFSHQNEKCKACRRHHQSRSADKNCCNYYTQPSTNACTRTKLRKEKSSNDIPLREANAPPNPLYNLQRKIRTLKEQVRRRDLHLELLKRKLSLVEDGTQRKCIYQKERDEAIHQMQKANDTNCKLSAQLVDLRTQLTKARAQLAEAVDYKIIALERARHIDELTSQICNLEEEKIYLTTQVNVLKERLNTSSESFQNIHSRDENLIKSLRDDIEHSKRQLADTKLLLSQLQAFRTAIAHTLHLSDLSENDLLRRLQTLCSIHKGYNTPLLDYKADSPFAEHICAHYGEPITRTKCSSMHSSPSQHTQQYCFQCMDNNTPAMCDK